MAAPANGNVTERDRITGPKPADSGFKAAMSFQSELNRDRSKEFRVADNRPFGTLTDAGGGRPPIEAPGDKKVLPVSAKKQIDAKDFITRSLDGTLKSLTDGTKLTTAEPKPATGAAALSSPDAATANRAKFAGTAPRDLNAPAGGAGIDTTKKAIVPGKPGKGDGPVNSTPVPKTVKGDGPVNSTPVPKPIKGDGPVNSTPVPRNADGSVTPGGLAPAVHRVGDPQPQPGNRSITPSAGHTSLDAPVVQPDKAPAPIGTIHPAGTAPRDLNTPAAAAVVSHEKGVPSTGARALTPAEQALTPAERATAAQRGIPASTVVAGDITQRGPTSVHPTADKAAATALAAPSAAVRADGSVVKAPAVKAPEVTKALLAKPAAAVTSLEPPKSPVIAKPAAAVEAPKALVPAKPVVAPVEAPKASVPAKPVAHVEAPKPLVPAKPVAHVEAPKPLVPAKPVAHVEAPKAAPRVEPKVEPKAEPKAAPPVVKPAPEVKTPEVKTHASPDPGAAARARSEAEPRRNPTGDDQRRNAANAENGRRPDANDRRSDPNDKSRSGPDPRGPQQGDRDKSRSGPDPRGPQGDRDNRNSRDPQAERTAQNQQNQQKQQQQSWADKLADKSHSPVDRVGEKSGSWGPGQNDRRLTPGDIHDRTQTQIAQANADRRAMQDTRSLDQARLQQTKGIADGKPDQRLGALQGDPSRHNSDNHIKVTSFTNIDDKNAGKNPVREIRDQSGKVVDGGKNAGAEHSLSVTTAAAKSLAHQELAANRTFNTRDNTKPLHGEISASAAALRGQRNESEKANEGRQGAGKLQSLGVLANGEHGRPGQAQAHREQAQAHREMAQNAVKDAQAHQLSQQAQSERTSRIEGYRTRVLDAITRENIQRDLQNNQQREQQQQNSFKAFQTRSTTQVEQNQKEQARAQASQESAKQQQQQQVRHIIIRVLGVRNGQTGRNENRLLLLLTGWIVQH